MEAAVVPQATALSRKLTLIGSRENETNLILLDALRARGIEIELMSAAVALGLLRPGDLALARLDVLPTLDGPEPGLLAVLRLERRGIRVSNSAASLLNVHDKLRTARILAAAGLPHPRTTWVAPGGRLPEGDAPLVLKPRFGSWGRDVFRCQTGVDAARVVRTIGDRRWFRRHGVLVQELLPPSDHDLRLIVAGGEVIGAALRSCAPGEWRTNVSLGGSLSPLEPPAAARTLARAAAAATGIDVVGVDLLPTPHGYVVLELNGAVDFDDRYSLAERDVHDNLIRALSLAATGNSAL